jgi:hypothetical protein
MHRSRFADRILAELRGIIDERGGSPFWDGVAGRFFGMSFQEADYFNAINGHQFIADLMPKHPVYIAMLPETARTAIGLPHPSGRAAMRMLEAEGFAYEGYVDIFDGGPTMTARTDRVASVANARQAELIATDAADGERALVATGELEHFRCGFGGCCTPRPGSRSTKRRRPCSGSRPAMRSATSPPECRWSRSTSTGSSVHPQLCGPEPGQPRRHAQRRRPVLSARRGAAGAAKMRANLALGLAQGFFVPPPRPNPGFPRGAGRPDRSRARRRSVVGFGDVGGERREPCRPRATLPTGVAI